MSGAETIKPEGGTARIGIVENDRADVGELNSATCELVDMVTEASWQEALRQLGGLPINPLPLWTILASRILRAVANGERDPQRLERLALDGLNDREGFGGGR